MNVYALIGESGSGKSHKAWQVAYKYEIHYIIDDGLLIKDRYKIAGCSAKKEKTKVMAVKRAIFFKDDHRVEVRDALRKINPEKILILGTSYKMIKKICDALEIDEPEKIVYINEISSEDEIEKAKKMRNTFGQHVIPLPEIEVQKDFPYYWINPLYTLMKRKNKKKKIEKTIVRPHFTSLGKLVISEAVISEIIEYYKRDYQKSISRILREVVNIDDDGVEITIELKVKVNTELAKEIYRFKKELLNKIEDTTGLVVKFLNIEIKSVDFNN